MTQSVKIGLIAAAVVAVGGYVVASVKLYIDKAAAYEVLQDDIAALRADGAVLRDSIAAHRARVAERDSIIVALRAETTQLREVRAALMQQRRVLRTELADARRARFEADSALFAAREAVDENRLPRHVTRLLLAERTAAEAAREEARSCDATLGNCEEEVANLEAQIGGKDAEIELLDKTVAEKAALIVDLETFNARMDSTVTVLNDQLKPSFFESLTDSKFLTGTAIGVGLGVVVTLLVSGGG